MTVRLPALWVLGAVAVCLAGPTYASVVSLPSMPLLAAGNVYEVGAGWHFALPMAAVFVTFAAFYWLAPKLSNRRYSAGFGGLHLFLMLVGAGLIALPQRVLALQGMPLDTVDYPRAFALWNGISMAGYFALLGGLLVFLMVVTQMFLLRRKAQA